MYASFGGEICTIDGNDESVAVVCIDDGLLVRTGGFVFGHVVEDANKHGSRCESCANEWMHGRRKMDKMGAAWLI